MFFANATISSDEFGEGKIAICSDEATEQAWAGRRGYGLARVWRERPIADSILKAAAQETLPVPFTCNGVRYQLLKYNCRSEERFHNPYRKNHVVRKERLARYSDIYVYTERCRCTSCFAEFGFDSIENICGLVQTADDPRRIVEIDIQHCKHCGSYFIDQQSLIEYERRYGTLRISKHHITGNEEYSNPRGQITYKENTILSRYGYSTSLYTSERRRILVHLLESGKSSKAEIKDILTRFISQRSERCPDAAVVWANDLEFVNDYGIENEDVVKFQ